VVSEKRRRELARAKWERQQARRSAAESRARKLRIVGGVAASVVAVVLIGLGVRALVGGASSQAPTFPTENTLTMKTPATGPTVTRLSSGSPTTGATSPAGTRSTSAPTPTVPVTTGTTGSGTP